MRILINLNTNSDGLEHLKANASMEVNFYSKCST